ncbi:MAG: S41 family peptidase [Cyclobacteriaceae bacterium]|nr:S41 family peptidase [Cyclobacteriaceae bacterium]
MSESENTKNQIALPLVLAIGLAAGVLIGASFKGDALPVSGSDELDKFREVIGLIRSEYVDPTQTDSLVEDAIQHMLGKLDPHSVYIAASERQEANEDLRGNFEGIGIEFNIFHDTLVVVTALSGGPSESVGIQSGDKIIKVGEKSIAGVGITNTDVFKLLKGPKGTEVKIEILRKNQHSPITFNIIRDKIPQYSVDVSYMVAPEIGYIKISRFSQTTYQEFQQGLAKLRDKGMKKLIIDLQGNPGGYMNQAIDLADEFLPEGSRIVYTKGQDKRNNANAMSTNKGTFERGDLIVLVNEGSASAAEILAGALQDNDRALVVGRRSFGKGLVQSPFDLNDGSELRLTISRYYTPSGRSIQKPYVDKGEYARDLAYRYRHGEFFTSDSIRFNDSLKYKTTGGRTVYGGGGIMPDYFVPLDTTLDSHYLNQLYNSNAIQEYTFKYADKHQAALKAQGWESFYREFDVTDAMLEDLGAAGVRNGVKLNPVDLKSNRRAFQAHVKAQIARKIWGGEGFYPIYNETNEILQQAIRLFDRIPDLNRNKM